MANRWKAKLQNLSFAVKLFCVLLLADVLVHLIWPGSALGLLVQAGVFGVAFWLALRWTRVAVRKVIWGLRNRLLVTYLFIAVVPVSLVVVLAALGAYALISQYAVYLAISDLDRRAQTLRDIADTVAATDAPRRPEIMRRFCELHHRKFPKMLLSVKSDDTVQTWPPTQETETPPQAGVQGQGVAMRKGKLFLWSHAKSGAANVTVLMPLSRAYLSGMIPGLGDVGMYDLANQETNITASSDGNKVTYLRNSHEIPTQPLPPRHNWLDPDVYWFSTVPVWLLDQGKRETTLLFVHTRPSAVLRTIFDTPIDPVGQILEILLFVVAVLFLLVEVVALIIGTSLTSTITRAVQSLYDGTQRVMHGDFTHRIQVQGRDQLAELGTSFNSMTESLEHLLAVSKEKERLQAELEIARQVQEQLYPKVMPDLRTLGLTAIWQPARMVSGDYYDYLCLADGRLMMAIGDVAGKGISAALLMASIQSALRMELRTAVDEARFPTSRLVADLNQQLYATTAPEKYATFFLALYNETTGELHYTNAGHLPPLLVRNGTAVRLEVSGTVVGAFPFAKYADNRIQMQSGDLLVCYTDGITEPENEYGEEFGEDRLIALITKNADKDDQQLVSIVLDSVRQWSSAPEQPDDMTVLLARKV